MVEKYETIIWDWNGTILNDVSLCVGITNEVLRDRGMKEFDEAAYRNIFGFPISKYYERIGFDLEVDSMEALTKNFITKYGANIKNCKLHENVKSVLERLQNYGKEQYVLTAAHRESVMPLLDHYQLTDYFKAVAGLDNHRAESKISKGKELFSENNISIEKAVLIGDTMHDFEVSKELGINCILIANGHQSKERLAKKIGDDGLVLEDVGDLLTYC